MIYFILNIVASIVKWLLQPFLYTYGFFASIYQGEFSYWHKELALSKDRWGNVLLRYIGNALLIKKGGYEFGFFKETISKVLGINKKNGTLTNLGKLICFILNSLDKNHVENATKE